MVGHDERDSTSLTPEQGNAHEDFTRDLNKPLNGLRIGVPKEYFGEGLAADVESSRARRARQFVKLGAVLVDISLPKTALSIPTYYIIAPAEASSNLSRFDGVRYGHRAREYKDLQDMYKKTRAEGFGKRSPAPHHGRHLRAVPRLLRRLLRAGAEDPPPDRRRLPGRVRDKCDVIMGPVAPTVAWDLGSKANDPVANYLADIFTLVDQPGRPARHVDPLRFRPGREECKAPGRPANHRQLFQPKRSC
jgi:aspartyl-tRNA(Asn)/glutamyl-tRNA(Gln) amidotransferase subunit A